MNTHATEPEGNVRISHEALIVYNRSQNYSGAGAERDAGITYVTDGPWKEV